MFLGASYNIFRQKATFTLRSAFRLHSQSAPRPAFPVCTLACIPSLHPGLHAHSRRRYAARLAPVPAPGWRLIRSDSCGTRSLCELRQPPVVAASQPCAAEPTLMSLPAYLCLFVRFLTPDLYNCFVLYNCLVLYNSFDLHISLVCFIFL